MNFMKFLRTPFLQNTSAQLLLTKGTETGAFVVNFEHSVRTIALF